MIPFLVRSFSNMEPNIVHHAYEYGVLFLLRLLLVGVRLLAFYILKNKDNIHVLGRHPLTETRITRICNRCLWSVKQYLIRSETFRCKENGEQKSVCAILPSYMFFSKKNYILPSSYHIYDSHQTFIRRSIKS